MKYQTQPFSPPGGPKTWTGYREEVQTVLWSTGHFSLFERHTDGRVGEVQPLFESLSDILSGRFQKKYAGLFMAARELPAFTNSHIYGFHYRDLDPFQLPLEEQPQLTDHQGRRLSPRRQPIQVSPHLIKITTWETQSLMLVWGWSDSRGKIRVLKPGQLFVCSPLSPNRPDDFGGFPVGLNQRALPPKKSGQLGEFLNSPPAAVAGGPGLGALPPREVYPVVYPENLRDFHKLAYRPDHGHDHLNFSTPGRLYDQLDSGRQYLKKIDAAGPFPTVYLSVKKDQAGQPRLRGHFGFSYTTTTTVHRLAASPAATALGWAKGSGSPNGGEDIGSPTEAESPPPPEKYWELLLEANKKFSKHFQAHARVTRAGGNWRTKNLFYGHHDKDANPFDKTVRPDIEASILADLTDPREGQMKLGGLTIGKHSGRLFLPGTRLLTWLEENRQLLRQRGILVLLEESYRPFMGKVLPKLEIDMSKGSGTRWFHFSWRSSGISLDQMKAALAAWEKGDIPVEFSQGQSGDDPNHNWKKFQRLFKLLSRTGSARKIRPGRALAILREINRVAGSAPDEPHDIQPQISVNADQVREKFREILENPAGEVPPTERDARHWPVEAKLRDYQLDGAFFLYRLFRHGLGGILADDMGLGKTLQVIALAARLFREDPRVRFLVICPTSAITVWQKEIEKFAPQLSTSIWHGPGRFRKTMRNQVFTLTSYGTFRRDWERLTGERWSAVILDEAQIAKNKRSQTSQLIRKIPAESVFALTGTPLENHYDEFQNIMDMVMPGYLADGPGTNGWSGLAAAHYIRGEAGPFLLRRTKDQVLTNLPPLVEKPVLVDMPARQLGLYQESLRDARREIEAVATANPIVRMMVRFKQMNRLRRIACHPQIKDPAICRPEDSGKLLHFRRKLPEWSARNGVLVFSQYTDHLKIVARLLTQHRQTYDLLTGATTRKERQSRIEQFQAGKFQFFLISLKAGGTGLTLTRADTVVMLDPWWNPAVENQARDRAYRIGQTRPVHVYKLYCRGSIEEKVWQLQRVKQERFDDLLGDPTLSRVSPNLVEDLSREVFGA